MKALNGLGSLLGSPRFHGILIVAVLQALVLFNIINSEQGEGLILILQGVIAAAIVNKTVDKVGDKGIVAAGVSAGTVDVRSVAEIPPQE